MKTNNNYDLAEYKCNYAFTTLYSVFLEKSFKKNKKNVKSNFKNRKSFYDLDLIITDDEGINDELYLIELKIRKTHYDKLLLEKKKYDNIIKIKEEKEKEGYFRKYRIFYINFTPQGTYIFDLEQLKDIEWGTSYNKRNTAYNGAYIQKETTMLNTEADYCRKINYIYNEDDFKKYFYKNGI